MKPNMKYPKLILAACALIMISGMSFAQEAQKKVKIKIDKDENGKQIKIDTLINHSDLEAFKVYLLEQGIELPTHEEGEMHKRVEVRIEKDKDGKVHKHVQKFDDDGDHDKKVIIIKHGNGETIEWTGDEKTTKKEKRMRKSKSMNDDSSDENIFIIKERDSKDAIWISDEKDGEKAEFKIIGTDQLMDDDAGKGKKMVIIEERIEGENGKEKHIYVMVKIEIEDLDEADINTWAEKGEDKKILSGNLEASELSFYPNPNDGNFTLKFSLDGSGKTTVRIVDLAGKEVYDETIENFSGDYINTIDISEESKGVYLLQVIQGNQSLNKKIILE